MPEPTLDDEFEDISELADHIVGQFAADNKGVAEVIPSEQIDDHLDAAVVNAEQFGTDEWDDLVLEVKDEILEQDVMIA